MEKKIRIQLFNEELVMQSDRLLTQDAEFNVGPKLQHSGPIRIEFTLMGTDDIARCKEYLDKLTGVVPLISKEVKTRGRKPSGDAIPDTDDRAEMLSVFQQCSTQDEAIEMVKNCGFRFMTIDLFEAMGYLEGRSLPVGIKKGDYQILMRCLKQAKDPKNDKYDPELIFGIKLMGDKEDKVLFFLQGEKGKFDMPWAKKSEFNFKKTSMMKFPEYMTLEEREKWRREHRLSIANPEKEPSKFYARWKPYIEVGDGDI